MMVFAHTALLDADSRLLLWQDGAQADLPGCRVATGCPAATLVAFLQAEWGVTTFAKAFFPLAFAADGDAVRLVYGCRNWAGTNGLQHPAADAGIWSWVRPARLLDRPVSALCRDVAPTLMSLIG